MITNLLITVVAIATIILMFFTLIFLSKQPKNLWMLIPSIVLGIIFANLSADEFESDFMAYILVFPLVMFCILGLLYNIVPQSPSKK